jgi:ATP-dependent RNA/DNA helicase IGHMBP2
MIVSVAVTNKTIAVLGGVPGEYGAVCADLEQGWTLRERDYLVSRPARLQIVGRRFVYEAQLAGYRLPEGWCICGRSRCRCRGGRLKAGDTPGQLLLLSAMPREAWDGSDEDVLRKPRYYDPFEQSYDPLDGVALARLTERWDRAHAQRAAAMSGLLGHLNELNRIRSFVARELGALVPLAERAWDPERLAEGQLVLLTRGPAAADAAARDFVYRLPNLDVALRVEDLSEQELIIDCGEQDLVRVEQYLQDREGRPLRLTLDREEADRKIEREARTLREAQSRDRLCALIAKPALARSLPRDELALFNEGLDPGQRAFVAAALAARDLLLVQGPPGSGKTTGICEYIRQYLALHPHAQILLAAQTHQAVDNVLLRLAREDPDLPIARVASVHTIKRVNETVRARYWIDGAEPWRPPVVRRALVYRQLMESQLRAGDRTEDETLRGVLSIQDDYLASIGPQRTPQERLAQARVIAGTCAAVRDHPEVRAIRFPVAILEEAGKATPPEALMVMARAETSILVGDSRQLPPHPWDPMRAVLREPATLTTSNPDRAEEAGELRASIEALGATPREREQAERETLFDHFAEHLAGTEHELMLTTQYRMLPEIGELTSRVFYGDIGGLHHGRERPVDPRVQAFAGETRVKLVDIPGREEQGADGKSKRRPAEVEHIASELRALQAHAAPVPPPPGARKRLGVAVITPYAAQARHLRAGLDLTQYPALDVRVGIVDRFQGDEDQVVILSIAATTVAGFLKVPNRINVALSRAQDLLIVTTSLPAAIQGRIGEPLQHVARFIDEQVKHGNPGYQIHRTRPQTHRTQRRKPQRDRRRNTA